MRELVQLQGREQARASQTVMNFMVALSLVGAKESFLKIRLLRD